ncbi:MAG: hypothetical protein WD009_09165 [Phycisphaeraceae bacterium]
MSKQSNNPPGPRVDRELEEFRSLLEPPSTFEDGFSWATFLGAIFVALLMVPGSIYMTLIAGTGSVGPAAQWVTVILFIEVARRANKTLRKAQIFTLFYVSSAIMVTVSQLEGNFHGGMGALWAQFYRTSDAATAAGVAEQIPNWVAPRDPGVLDSRYLFRWEWLPALGLIAFNMIVGRLDNMVLGYGLFRLTSDLERLPFPMAPVQAQGIIALSEEQEEEIASHVSASDEPEDGGRTGNWRWRVFSVGAMLGLVFGLVYLGLPTVTGALLDEPITILPVPFIDYTAETADLLSAVPIAIALDLGQVILGMVLPFWAMVGSFLGLIITVVANPILYNGLPEWMPFAFQGDILSTWNAGDAMQETFYKNQIDFYFSFSIGIAMAIAMVGFWSVARGLIQYRRRKREHADSLEAMTPTVPEGRGDIPPALIVGIYLTIACLYITVSSWLLYTVDPEKGIHWNVVGVMCFYAFLYTPLVSYVSARLEGIAGEVVNIPFVREATLILSGYQGVAVWFLPMPFHNYGSVTVLYRSCELTGTKFWSMWKSELLLTPIVLVGSLAFAHFIWQMGPIPGPQYLYAQEWWEVSAANQAIVHSSTLGGFTPFEQALTWQYIVAGGVIGSITFAAFSWIGAPIFLVYGVVRGLNQTLPFAVIPQFIGALIGRYYFQRKLGLMWRQYIPVVFAGFTCGMGLVGTLGIGFTFLAQAVFQLPF